MTEGLRSAAPSAGACPALRLPSAARINTQPPPATSPLVKWDNQLFSTSGPPGRCRERGVAAAEANLAFLADANTVHLGSEEQDKELL